MLVLTCGGPPAVHGENFAFTAALLEGPGWRAENLRVTHAADGSVEVGSTRLQWTGAPALEQVRLRCTLRRVGAELHCKDGQVWATMAPWGPLRGTLGASFADRTRWRAQLAFPRRGLSVGLSQTPAQLAISARMPGHGAASLGALAASMGMSVPGKISGRVDVDLSTRITPAATTTKVQLRTVALDYAEPSGRYAAEKLAARVDATWDGLAGAWKLNVAAVGGQLYMEPLFLDLTALPVHAALTVVPTETHWQLPKIELRQGEVGTLRGALELTRSTAAVQSADLEFDARALGPVVATDVSPYLIGTRLEGVVAEGRARGRVSLRAGGIREISAVVSDLRLVADRLGLTMQGVNGDLHWASSAAPASRLSWMQGSVARVPFESSSIVFRAQGTDVEILEPWRQPLLQGALRVQKLHLRGLGGAGLSAEFEGALEPIRLADLCTALGWPVFGGTLGGQLPGLRVQDQVWSLEGGLDAQVFDGTVRLSKLRALDPFGVLPRITADIRLRNLDLEPLTGAFEFGRITGRLDGDVRGLKLLAWRPVAFDARLYSSPRQDLSRRISQRAIDTISSVGGGPSGVLSRGFLRVFKDFSYDRLGISCVLRDGVCQMDGIAPAPAQDGRAGYYLVRGRLLPRIDVVGYTRAVSWNTLVQQINLARTSAGPQSGQAPLAPSSP